MDCSAAIYFRPRPGYTRYEYEDAWAGPRRAGRRLRAAVADGATETVFAGTWARLLVEGFLTHGPALFLDGHDVLQTVRLGWQTAVRPLSDTLPWYVSAKIESGAFAAFLGLEIDDRGAWQAVCIGDCELFHERNGTLLAAWPFAEASDFGYRPHLVSSAAGDPLPEPSVLTGVAYPGDHFLLATDAAAAYLLSRKEDVLPACASGSVSALVSSEPGPARDDLTLFQMELLDQA